MADDGDFDLSYFALAIFFAFRFWGLLVPVFRIFGLLIRTIWNLRDGVFRNFSFRDGKLQALDQRIEQIVESAAMLGRNRENIFKSQFVKFIDQIFLLVG